MDKSELENRLKNLEVPDVKLPGHRSKLRASLIAAATDSLPESNFWDSSTDQFKIFFRSLVQPWRKMVTVGLLAVILAFMGVIGSRTSGSVSPTVLAADIALSSPEINGQLSGDGEVHVLDIGITGEQARVVCGRDINHLIEANVDLKSRRIIRFQRLEGLFLSELAEKTRSEAIEIALTDPRVKQLMSGSGTVKRVMPSFASIFGITRDEENILKLLTEPDIVMVQIESDGHSWIAQISIKDRIVERIIELQIRMPGLLTGSNFS